MTESGMKVYARCKESDGGVFRVAGDTLQTKGEEKVWGFHKILGGDVFGEACVKVCEGCVKGGFPKGGFGSIVTLSCDEMGRETLSGLAPQVFSYLLSKGATSLKVQMCDVRNDTCVDLIGGKQGVKVSVDDKAGVAIDASSETCRSADTATALFTKSLAMTHPSMSQFCVLITIQKGSTTLGRLFLIDVGNMTRQPTVERPQADIDEQVLLSKLHLTLSQCTTGMANGKDFRVLPFRDSKVTRILQHPLHHSIAGQGLVSLIFCVSQATSLDDTLCLLNTASLAQGSQLLKNISAYKDLIEELEQLVDANERRMTQADGNTKASASLYKMKLKELDKLGIELASAGEKKEQKLAASKKQLAKEHKREEVEKMDGLREGVVESRRSLQMAQEVIDGVDGAVAAAVRRYAEKHEIERREYRRKVEKQIAKEKEANDAMAFDISVKKRRADQLRAWEQRVKREIATLESSKEALKDKASRATGPSRTEGLTPEEIHRKAEYFRLLDEIDDIEETNEEMRGKVRALKEETNMDVPTDSEDEDTYSDDDGKSLDSGESSRDTSLPPSASSDLPDSDSDSVSSSSSSSAGLGKIGLQKKRAVEGSAMDLERRQFKFTLKKEQNLMLLVEQIMQYLEFGTNFSLVQSEPPHITRKYAYLTPEKRTHLNLCNLDPSTGLCSDKKNVAKEIVMADITAVGLGQSSQVFSKAMRGVGASVSFDATQMPPSSQGLAKAPGTLGQYFYRSLTLTLKDGMQVSFVADSDVDFEAWVVALHRVTFLVPQWETHQDISRNSGVNKLTELEKHFCTENHVTPLNYLNAKYQILSRKQLLITLYDVRTASSLDLMHSQKLFELLCKTGHIEKTILWSLKGDTEPSEKPMDGETDKSQLFNDVKGVTDSMTDITKLATNDVHHKGLISNERKNLLKEGAGAAL
eukprot:TRINITY_DN7809_c0_g1_i2.p1 TRINITY_DN7809_c0_g1~~TRINITY_DN7809_c0_g1_i2.p1  ORF type:complete len:926 (+),score=244.95 TRINITY_DN7809_c0_g1_i2:49-2826(+)